MTVLTLPAPRRTAAPARTGRSSAAPPSASSSAALRSRVAWVDGARVPYLEAGPEDAPPLLFLHGWGLAPSCYAEGLRPLTAAGLRVVAPALPGFAGSAPSRRVSLSAFAERTAGLLDALGVDRPAFVVGHSLGGGVALQLAHEHRQRVRSLVLVDPVGGGTGALRLPHGLATLAELDAGELRASALPGLRAIVPAVVRAPLASALAGRLALSAALAPLAARLVASGLPVQLVWADGDRLLAQGALADVPWALPPQRVRGRHGWLLARPQEFSELVRNAVVVHGLLERRRGGGGPLVLPAGRTLGDLLHGARSAA